MLHTAVNRSRAWSSRAAGLALALCSCSKGHDLDVLPASGVAPDAGQLAAAAGTGVAGSAGRISTGASGSAGTAGAGGGGGVGAAGLGAGGGTAGRGGAAGRGGTTGRGGMAGRGGGTAGASSAVSHDVSACMPCQAAMGLVGTLEACCTTAGKCGVDISSFSGQASCAQQNAPGNQTMACPSTSLMGIATIPGCCGADGVCGLVIMQLAPLGCVHASDLGSLVSVPGPPMRCTP
jgi:hypothetical protein